MSSSKSSSRSRTKSKSTLDKSTAKTTTGKTGHTTPYDPNFEQNLIEHGFYPEGYEYLDNRQTPEPNNLEEINQILAEPRPSLSPSRFSNGDFQDFKRKNIRAKDEDDVMHLFPEIAGNAKIPSRKKKWFGNIEHLTDGSIARATPDFYDGSRPEKLDLQVREKLWKYILPSADTSEPILPNFF